MRKQYVLLCAATITLGIQGLNNGLGRTPAMGWNTWNKYGCAINEKIIKDNAAAIVANGLDKLGYVYVNIDDCWASKDRDANGHIIPDATNFPNGMAPVGKIIHDAGLKFGIYSSAGTLTCQQRAASLGKETIDAQDFAKWEVDYLKYDNCFNAQVPAPERYKAMSDALNSTGRPIYYSVCSWGDFKDWEWAPAIANSWRTTDDIFNNWASVRFNFLQNSRLSAYAAPGQWNDPDMLQVGNGVLSLIEEKTHFALWCFVKSPLILGNDLTQMTTETLEVISNKALIRMNQDSNGNQAVCVQNCNGDLQVFKNFQVDGGAYYGVLIVNWHATSTKSILLDFLLIGVALDPYYICTVTDMWTGIETKNVQKVFFIPKIPPHGNAALKVKCLPWMSKPATQEHSAFLNQ